MGKDNDQINSKDFLIGTLIGGIIGATAALFLAPKSGKELRQDLNEGAIQVKDKATEWASIAQEKGSDLKDKVVQTSSDIKNKATAATSQLTKTVTEKTQDITQTVKEKIGEARN